MQNKFCLKVNLGIKPFNPNPKANPNIGYQITKHFYILFRVVSIHLCLVLREAVSFVFSRVSMENKTSCFPREQTLSALLYIQRMDKLSRGTNKLALRTACLSTVLILLNTANVRQIPQIHGKRKQRTDLISRHFRNPSALNVFWLRFSNKK